MWNEKPNVAAFCKSCGTRLIAAQKAPSNTAVRAPSAAQRGGAKKKRPFFTTKKTHMAYWVTQVIGDSCFLALAAFSFIRARDLIDSYWYRSEGEKLQTVGFLMMAIFFLSFLYHAMVSRTYADFFEDRITGSGMQGIQNKSFSIRLDQVVGISVSKGFLNMEAGGGAFLIINTAAGDYKIVTTTARANEIAEYYSKWMHQSSPRHAR